MTVEYSGFIKFGKKVDLRWISFLFSFWKKNCDKGFGLICRLLDNTWYINCRYESLKLHCIKKTNKDLYCVHLVKQHTSM